MSGGSGGFAGGLVLGVLVGFAATWMARSHEAAGGASGADAPLQRSREQLRERFRGGPASPASTEA